MSSTVVILILNWNNFADTYKCIRSVLDLDYRNHTIVIIDNGSTDGSLKQLQEAFAHTGVVFLNSGSNLGYAGGMNVGINYALRKIPFDFIWLLNNDIEVKHDSLDILLAALKENPDIDIAGPTLLLSGTDRIMEQYYTLNLWRGRYLIHTHLNRNHIARISSRNNTYIGGAAVFMRCRALDNLGLIPEEYFLYNEDVAWQSSYKGDHDFLYVGPAIVWHKRSASSGGVKTVLPDYYDSRNFLYFMRKEFPLWLPYEFIMSIINKVLPKVVRREWKRLQYVLYGFRDFFRGKTGKFEP